MGNDLGPGIVLKILPILLYLIKQCSRNRSKIEHNKIVKNIISVGKAELIPNVQFSAKLKKCIAYVFSQCINLESH